MSTADVQAWLLDNTGFRDRLRSLTLQHVVQQFGSLNVSPGLEQATDWNYMLLCASLLSQDTSGRPQDASLRIAQSCLESQETTDDQKDAAAVILHSLANQPAIQLAEIRHLLQPGVVGRLPAPLMRDWLRRSVASTIWLASGRHAEMNHFQRQVWSSLESAQWVSASAPTSSGKSFVLTEFVREFASGRSQACIIYVVPTRALIQQVQTDIKTVMADAEAVATITSMPWGADARASGLRIFVLTQERLHLLLAKYPSLLCDLLIVDEAQKVGDGYRGILLEHAVETAVARNRRCIVLYASPFAGNPELLLENAPDGATSLPVNSEEVTVNQNLLWLSHRPGQPKVWDVSLVNEEEAVTVGSVSLRSTPGSGTKRLPFVAHAIGDELGGNLVYVNGAAVAEKTALQLYDLRATADNPPDDDINALQDLVRRTVHKDYALIKLLDRRVAFHYGNMPLLIRTTIESLFRQDKLRYLVCTSTLVEGVNLPCKSIFVRGPKKGRQTPMSSEDFWNLAGRAGRWGKEFQGNIVCVDVARRDVWTQPPPRSKQPAQIQRAFDSVLGSSQGLIKYIQDPLSVSPRDFDPRHEYVFSFLTSVHIREGTLSTLPWLKRYPPGVITQLEDLIASAVSASLVPNEIILRHAGVNPTALSRLIEYFQERTTTRQKSVEDLLLVPPDSDDAHESYIAVLHRISNVFGNVFGSGPRRIAQLALLLRDWMRGYQLARLIANREQRYGNGNISQLIRWTMDDVEQYARFRGPKYLGCYNDLLRFYLLSLGRSDLAERMVDVDVMLEFGVSQQTQLALLSLGLSRSSAIALSDYIANDALTSEEALGWLRENKWMTYDVPTLVKAEVSRLLDGTAMTPREA